MPESRKQYWIIATTEDESRRADLESRQEQLAHEHHAYIDSLNEKGILLIHGAARDELGARAGTGYIVFEAATRLEAEAIAVKEPYIANGFRTLQLIPWQARLGRAAQPR
jgi:uncharacterized protein YciI